MMNFEVLESKQETTANSIENEKNNTIFISDL